MRIQLGLGKLITACFLLTLTFPGISQEPYEPGKVIQPSPTAASLGVYGNFKMGYYSGTPDITIPIYTIKTGHNTVPIFMKYNASGFRVSEMAGWVGLGWSLNAGGIITKTVRGLDDFGNGGYYSASTLPTPDPSNGWPKVQDYPYYDACVKGQMDAEPDIFSYNFGEYSGKFVIGKRNDGSIVYMADKNNIKIKFDQNSSTWTVTTPDGYKYIFTTEERQQNFYFSATYPNAIPMTSPLSTFHWDGRVDAITAWNLNSIVAPNGETITFTYQVKSFTVGLTNRMETEYNMTKMVGGCNNQASFPGTVKQFSYSKQVIADQYLTTITFDNGSVEFSTEDRDDLEYMATSTTNKPKRLAAITIKDKAGNQFKKYQFDYGYFTGGSQKLRLNSITELGKNNEANCPYVFSYYNPGGLQQLYTNAIDHWGFYNDHPNDGLLPPGEMDEKFFPGARRVPDGDLENMKAAVISSITYPTGGSTNFEYEMNEYSNLTGEDKYNIEFDRYQAYAYDDDPMSHGVVHFDLTEPTNVEFAFGYQDIDNIQGGRMVGVQVVYGTCGLQGVGQVTSFSNWDPVAGHETGEQIQRRTKYLMPGHYTISVSNIQGYFTEVAVSYNKKTLVAQRKGGGLRVKTITNYDKGNKVSVKKYSYLSNDVNNETSGKLICQPRYLYVTGVNSHNATCDALFLYMGRVSHSMMPPYLAGGSALIGYDRVIETLGDNGEGGRNEYYFHNAAETVTFNETPFVNGYLNPTNGNLATTVVKDAAGNVVRIKESSYLVITTSVLPGVKVFQPNAIDITLLDNKGLELRWYNDYSDWVVTSSEKETVKQTGSPDLVTSTQYFYDNADHLQLTRKESTGSNGKTQITRYRYPEDYTSAPASSFVSGMKAGNQVNNVIEQITAVKTGQTEKLTEGVFTEYMLTNSLYQPYKVYKIETREPSTTTAQSDIAASGQIVLNPLFKETVTFDLYDATGNLNTYHKSGDAYQTYIWDKTISKPIAQAANTASDQVAYTSFESAETGNWMYTGGSYNPGDGITGKQSLYLSGTTISKSGLNAAVTYVVSYWCKSGSVQVNGAPGTAGMSKNFWTYFEHTVSNATDITVTGSGLIDELRLHPSGVPMITYTYDPLIGITTQADQNNRITYYEYDGLARLLRVRDGDNNILKQFDYKCQDVLNTPVWQATGVTRCKPCDQNNSYNSNIKQQEEKDINPNNSGITRWTDIGVSSDCALQPAWQNTAAPLRCRTVNGVNTSEREQEQHDNNPCSNQGTRWVVVDQNCATCATDSNWQVTGNTRCAVDGNGYNTGYQEREERDISACGNNQIRWVDNGYHPTVCAPPCSYYNCENMGPQYRCVGYNCEEGYKVYTDAEWDGAGWMCTYHWEWSDGTWSYDYTELSGWHCN